MPSFFTTGSPHVDLSAPGERIWVAVPTLLHPPDDYDQFDGTSFASPMVAAAADWVWSVRPTLDASQVFDIMRASAQDVWTPGFDPYSGFGRLDIPAALDDGSAAAGPAGAERGRLVRQARRDPAPGDRAAHLGRPQEREHRRAPRSRRRPARRVPVLGPARQGRLGRAPAHRRRRRPCALGAEDRERARDRPRSGSGIREGSRSGRGRSASGCACGTPSGKGAYFYAEAVLRGRKRQRLAAPGRDQLRALGLDRQREEARSTLTIA